MTVPVLSVLTVVRQNLDGLRRTHASLCAQRDAGPWEWIVVDGASTDGTPTWLAAHPDAAWWRSAPDGGIYDAMNVALGAARGEAVLFLNGGDTLAAPDTLARLATAVLGGDGVGFWYGDALERHPDGRLSAKPARSHRWAFYGMFTHHQAMLYRRGALAGMAFDMRYPVGADYDFTLRLLARRVPVRRLDFPVCVFACGGASQRAPAQGRRDQTAIRRAVLRMGWASCAAVTAAQWGALALRGRLPVLYAALRRGRAATFF